VLYAIGIQVYTAFYPPRFGDFVGALLTIAEGPAIGICQAIGIKADTASGNLTLFALCLSVLITAILGSLIGAVFEKIAKRRQSEKDDKNVNL
jgi:hypothetical protein